MNMATRKRQRLSSFADEVDSIIRKIFLVTLVDNNSMEEKQDSSSSSSSSVVVYLERTATQLLNEGKPLTLCEDLMECVLIDRLSGQFHGVEPSIPYLIGCYHRVYELETQLTSMDFIITKPQWAAMISLLCRAYKLVVSYCRTHLAKSSNDKSPLLPLLFLEVSGSTENNESGGGRLDYRPPGFFKLLLEDSSDLDSLNLILNSLYEDLSRSLAGESLLGNFQQPLRALIYLVKFSNAARALVNHPRWLPRGAHVSGIEMEKMSILGPFFHFSALPDDRFKGEDFFQLIRSVMVAAESNTCFDKNIRTCTNELQDGLEEVLLSLLENSDTQERVFEYLAAIIKQNSSMANIMVDSSCSSVGMFVNLSAVMLRLCKTFLDEDLTKRCEIDKNYVSYNTRLDLSKLTSLCASSEEVAASWIDKDKHGNADDGSNRISESEEATSSGNNMGLGFNLSKAKPMRTTKTEYIFTCEWFFMTARVLHLGLIKSLSDMNHVHKELCTSRNTLSTLTVIREQGSSPQLEQDIEARRRIIVRYFRKYLKYKVQIINDKAFLRQALSFYRLMVVWLVNLVRGFKLPLPLSCPKEFACMPEHFVEDTIEFLIVVLKNDHTMPVMDEFMNFIIMFMASPMYIRNTYIRERMVEVLSLCVSNKSCPSSTEAIFENNQLSLKYLVRNLLQLYVGKEFTASPTQKDFRNNIIVILEHLWKIPSHCNAWKQIAQEDTGFYLIFLNSVFNEVMVFLENCFQRILGLEKMEAEMSNTAESERRQFQERALNIHNKKDKIGDLMSYVMKTVGMLAFTSKQITVPFLLPQTVDIVATMLNYILLHLVGVRGKSLHLKNPSGYGYRPEILLNEIISICVHLARGDEENIFPAAISKDTRSYNEQLFIDAAVAVVQHEDSSMIQEFEELGRRAKVAALEAMDTDASLGEIPKDFLDPIEFTLMKDPVILPSTKTVDRAVILRHLLNYNTDPFSALPLTKDMIIPNVELKAKIDDFIRSKRK